MGDPVLFPNPEAYDEIKVVAADNVEYQIGRGGGWRLLALVPSQQSRDAFASCQYHGSASGCYSGCNGRKSTTEVLDIVNYVIGRKKDDPVAEIAARLEQAESRCNTLQRSVNDLTKEKKAVDEKLAEAEKRTEGLRQQHDGLTGNYAGLEARGRKLELDIAKLRTALGDLRMKEILGG